jgi:pimeloyl-ACP methyl ester carboxylesterase
VIIPGNPGDAIFYADLARALETRGHEVLVTSHLSLTAPTADLMPYAEHQADEIRRHLAGNGRRPEDVEVVLLGHSLGAYLAYLLVARRLVPVARVFMMCPFVARPSFFARLILQVVSSPRLFGLALALVAAIPRWLRRRLVAHAGAGRHADWVLEVLASDQALASAAMATVEAHEIARRPDPSYLFEEPLFRDPARFFPIFCRRDRWAPRTWSDPRAPAAHYLDRGFTHAFVVEPAQCEVVAALVHERL